VVGAGVVVVVVGAGVVVVVVGAVQLSIEIDNSVEVV